MYYIIFSMAPNWPVHQCHGTGSFFAPPESIVYRIFMLVHFIQQNSSPRPIGTGGREASLAPLYNLKLYENVPKLSWSNGEKLGDFFLVQVCTNYDVLVQPALIQRRFLGTLLKISKIPWQSNWEKLWPSSQKLSERLT